MTDFTTTLQLARTGDDEALARLLQHFGPLIRAELDISPKWQAEVDADDVMQVTYLDVFLRIGSCAALHEGAFKAWLLQIARNNLLDAIRGLEAERRPPPERRVRVDGDGDACAQLFELLGATTSTPSRVVSRAELKSLVDQGLERLPPDYARIIRLMDLDGCTGPQAAERTGRSRAAVHMLLGRARDRLRELLGTGTKFFSR